MKRFLPGGVNDPYAALRIPDFRNYAVASFLFTTGVMIQDVIIGYELYRFTHDPLAIGLTGLAEALPFMALTLYGGHAADRFSKKLLMLLSGTGMLLCSAFLFYFSSRSDYESLPPISVMAAIYAAIVFFGVCRAFLSPASSSLRAFLVPVELYENASTWSSIAWQSGAIIGPGISGFLYAWLGFARTVMVVLGLLIIVLVLFLSIGARPAAHRQPETGVWKSVREGIRFVFGTKIILYSISLDLFSVLFGGVVALLPIYAVDILHAGAEGLGILRAASSVGAMLTLFLLARVSVIEHAWRNLLAAVIGFGVCILVFSVSPWLMLSAAALFFSGAFDSVSVVIRATILQLMTPNEMRGRVQAVNGIFISSSNELGAFESGVAARLFGTIPSAVLGGIMTLAIAAFVSYRTKDLLGVRLTSAERKKAYE